MTNEVVWVEDDQQLRDQAAVDAQHLIVNYPQLTLSPLLARLMTYIYRSPPMAAGPEHRDPNLLDADALEACRILYSEVHEAVRKFDALSTPTRRALIRVVDTESELIKRDILQGFIWIAMIPPRATPRSAASVFLTEKVETLARYLLLVLNRLPELADRSTPGSYRSFIEEVLHLTGWNFSEEEVSAACIAVMRLLNGKKARSCGLRLSRVQRNLAKAWHVEHGFV